MEVVSDTSSWVGGAGQGEERGIAVWKLTITRKSLREDHKLMKAVNVQASLQSGDFITCFTWTGFDVKNYRMCGSKHIAQYLMKFIRKGVSLTQTGSYNSQITVQTPTNTELLAPNSGNCWQLCFKYATTSEVTEAVKDFKCDLYLMTCGRATHIKWISANSS